MKYFQKNIDWAYEQNISGEYVNKSLDMFMKMMFLRANSIEKVGVILKSSPIPKDLSPEEKNAYKEVLEEKALEAMDKALPLYEEAIKTAAKLGIAGSAWLEKVKERIREINPSSAALNIQIAQHQFKVAEPSAGPAAATASASAVARGASVKDKIVLNKETESEASPEKKVVVFKDDNYARNMKRIDNIIQMDLPVDEKVKQLKRIEMEAQRDIQSEEEQIQELKKKL
jgi:hypothetical protein